MGSSSDRDRVKRTVSGGGGGGGGGAMSAPWANPMTHYNRWTGKDQPGPGDGGIAAANDIGVKGIGKNPDNQTGTTPAPGDGGYGWGGLPFEPDFMSTVSSTGQLKSPFKLSTDMSPWIGMQKQMNAQGANAAGDQAGVNANVATGNAASSLAASGGLESGARERLFAGGELNRIDALGNISGQKNLADLNVDMAGKEMSDARMTTNLNNQIQGVNAKNIFNMSKYGEQMKGYAADKTGVALEKSGKK